MKWVKTLDGEYINLYNIVELRVTRVPNDYRFQGHCCVIAESSNWTFYLWEETLNEHNRELAIQRAEMFIKSLIKENEDE